MSIENMVSKGVVGGIELFSKSEVSTLSADEARTYQEVYESRPLIRMMINLRVRREARARGVKLKGADWEGIKDFFVAIAPIIIEIIKMFM